MVPLGITPCWWVGFQSCCPSSPAIALEACQAHIQRKDYAACQRTKQDVSNTQLYRAVGLFLCPGKVSFRLFHLLLVKHSNPKNNNSLCFFPNLHRLLRPLQCSRHSHLCSAHFPLSWGVSSACWEQPQRLPVWHSAGPTGMCSRVNVGGHTVMRP